MINKISSLILNHYFCTIFLLAVLFLRYPAYIGCTQAERYCGTAWCCAYHHVPQNCECANSACLPPGVIPPPCECFENYTLCGNMCCSLREIACHCGTEFAKCLPFYSKCESI